MTALVACNRLDVGYRKDEPVIRSVCFALDRGESALVIGHNGAGKTTLLRTLFGLLRPLSGHATVNGIDIINGLPRQFVNSGVRYLGQGARAFQWLTLSENRQILSRLYGFDEPPVARGAMPKQSVGNLSVGQRRLEALLMLSTGTPVLYLLDEPLAGLDPHARGLVLDWVLGQMNEGCSFIVVEQRFRELLQIFPRAITIRNHEVTFVGATGKLNDALLSDVFL